MWIDTGGERAVLSFYAPWNPTKLTEFWIQFSKKKVKNSNILKTVWVTKLVTKTKLSF